MRHALATVASVIGCVAGVACGGEASGPRAATPVGISDTVLFVGDTMPAVALLRLPSGESFVPGPGVTVKYEDLTLATFGPVLLENRIVRATGPGTLRLTIADGSQHWAFTANVAAVPDIRGLRHTRSICLFAASPSTFTAANPARVTHFDAPAASFTLGTLDGRPRFINNSATATLYLSGTQTDSSVDYYPATEAQPINRRVTSVTQRQMLVTFTATTSPAITMTESASAGAPVERQTMLVRATPDTGVVRFRALSPGQFCQTYGVVVEATGR